MINAIDEIFLEIMADVIVLAASSTFMHNLCIGMQTAAAAAIASSTAKTTSNRCGIACHWTLVGSMGMSGGCRIKPLSTYSRSRVVDTSAARDSRVSGFSRDGVMLAYALTLSQAGTSAGAGDARANASVGAMSP